MGPYCTHSPYPTVYFLFLPTRAFGCWCATPLRPLLAPKPQPKVVSCNPNHAQTHATQLAIGSQRRVNPPRIRLLLGSADNIHCDRVGELWLVTLTLFPLIMG